MAKATSRICRESDASLRSKLLKPGVKKIKIMEKYCEHETQHAPLEMMDYHQLVLLCHAEAQNRVMGPPLKQARIQEGSAEKSNKYN